MEYKQKGRPADSQAGTHIHIYRQSQTHRHTGTQAPKHTLAPDRHTQKQIQRDTNTWALRHPDTQDTQTNRHTDTRPLSASI